MRRWIGYLGEFCLTIDERKSPITNDRYPQMMSQRQATLVVYQVNHCHVKMLPLKVLNQALVTEKMSAMF